MSGYFDGAYFASDYFDVDEAGPTGFIPRDSTADLSVPSRPSAVVTVPTRSSAAITVPVPTAEVT